MNKTSEIQIATRQAAPPFPLVVLVAGIGYIVIGAMLLFSAFFSLWLFGSPVGNEAGLRWLAYLLGCIAMIAIGTNMLRGRHTGILIDGLCWILFGFGLLAFGGVFLFGIAGTTGAQMWMAKPTTDPENKLAIVILGVAFLLVGLAFSGVGVLLLRARKRYHAWRQWDLHRRFSTPDSTIDKQTP
jgi:hypothetical protein